MRSLHIVVLLSLSSLLGSQRKPAKPVQPPPAPPGHSSSWTFAVSGDSRNCGDIVMPAIAQSVRADKSDFYWHLGDFRAIYRFDQDYEHFHKTTDLVVTISDYLAGAWPDFIQNQLLPFQDLPVYLSVGNHEVIPPKTHDQLVAQFADWFDSDVIRKQRLADNPNDHQVRTYYHWIQDGIDFISLDNASNSFDSDQITWLKQLLDRDSGNYNIRALVLGMHEALPDSISEDHSMAQSSDGIASGRKVYQWLIEFHKNKPVYILASHSHFYMEGIFNTSYIRAHGGALPGWIVGTAGAERYQLPAAKNDAIAAFQNIYGYLSGEVTQDRTNPIKFTFKSLSESDVPEPVVSKYTAAFVHDCWVNNPFTP